MDNICRGYYRAHPSTVIMTLSFASTNIFTSPIELQPTESGKELENDLH